jgi:hypothetical protein
LFVKGKEGLLPHLCPSLTKEKNDTWEVRKQFLENCVEVEKQEVEALEAEVRVK